MSLWNIKNLPMPPINTYKTANNNIDIIHLSKIFQEGKKFFGDDKYMNAEYAVLSRIVYRMKQKFRSAKDFKALEKVHKALDNYFKTNIAFDLKSFIRLIPSKYTDDTYLPNKNIVDYILVRLQGLVKLMERVVETCKITAYLFDRRLNTGHFWKIGFIIFSVVSRIYVLGKYTAKFICEFYKKILPFSNQLKNNGRNWLPDSYILPKDLQRWLNVDWLDVNDEVQIIEASELSNIIQFFDLADDDDDIQFCDEYIMIDNDDKDIELINEFKSLEDAAKDTTSIKKSINVLRGFDIDEDIGEVIDINDSILPEDIISQEKSERDVQSITISDNSMQNDLEENCTSDSDEIIQIDDSFQHEDIGVQKNSVTSSDIMILDNSLLSDSQENNNNEKPNSSQGFSKNEHPNDIITILDTSSQSDLDEISYRPTVSKNSNVSVLRNKQLKASINLIRSEDDRIELQTLSKREKVMKKKRAKNNQIEVSDKPNIYKNINQQKRKLGINKISSKLITNFPGLTESSEVITLDDSYTENGKVKKKSAKEEKTKIQKVSEQATKIIYNNEVPENHDLRLISSKNKKNKKKSNKINKKDMQIRKELKSPQVEFSNSSSRKRKNENSAENSHNVNKMKCIADNDSPATKKMKKSVNSERSDLLNKKSIHGVNKNNSDHKVKFNGFKKGNALISNQESNVQRGKNKPKKSKKNKIISSYNISEGNHLKHVRYNTKDLKVKHNQNRKKKKNKNRTNQH